MKNARGIECSLYNGNVKDVLYWLSDKPFDFYIFKCTKIDRRNMMLPQTSCNFQVSPQELRELAKTCIWDLVLYLYPYGTDQQNIETYDDFIESSCICCLLFYDCGLLDIYIKETCLREQMYRFLQLLQAEDMDWITDISDKRIRLFV